MRKKISLVPCMGCEKLYGQLSTAVALILQQQYSSDILLNLSMAQIAIGDIKPEKIATPVFALNGCAVGCASKILEKNSIGVHSRIDFVDMIDGLELPKRGSPTLDYLTSPVVAQIAAKIKDFIDNQFDSNENGLPEISASKEPFAPQFSAVLEYEYSKFHFSVPVNKECLYFNWNEAWAYHLGNGKVAVGITDYLQQNLSDIILCELPEIGAHIDQFEAVASLESSKTVNEVLAPFTGKVIAVNSALVDYPELINEDPHGKGWIAILEANQYDAEKSDLMDSPQYIEALKEKVQQEGVHY